MKKLPTTDLFNHYQVFIHAVGILLGALYGFIDSHIWSPAEAYLLVMSLVLLDFGTGLLFALRTSKFCKQKAQRVVFTMIAYTALLFYTFQFSKLGGILPLLTHVVFVPMVIVTMISLVKNFRRLGWISANMALTINQKLDHKLSDNEPNLQPAPSGANELVAH